MIPKDPLGPNRRGSRYQGPHRCDDGKNHSESQTKPEFLFLGNILGVKGASVSKNKEEAVTP
jgi:hypothetical protein